MTPGNPENPPPPPHPFTAYMGIPYAEAPESAHLHGNPMSILQFFAAGLPHMGFPCRYGCISKFTWFFHVGGLFLVGVHMGFPCKDYEKHAKSTRHGDSM